MSGGVFLYRENCLYKKPNFRKYCRKIIIRIIQTEIIYHRKKS